MLNLLKTDLYRITRPRGLRGSLWQYLAVCAVFYVLIYLVFWMIAGGFDFSTGAITSLTTFSSPSAMIGDMMSGIFPLFVCFFVVEHVLADFKDGFARTLVSARAGRLSYFAERIVFAGIVTVIVFCSLSLLTVVLGLAVDTRFAAMDAPLAFLGWAVAICLNAWALAVISLIVAYATRIVPLSYIVAFCIAGSLVPDGLSLIAGLIQGYAPGLMGISDVLREFACWMPSNLETWLCNGGAQAMAAGWGELGAALPGTGLTQAILAPALWIAAASAVVLAICRARDI